MLKRLKLSIPIKLILCFFTVGLVLSLLIVVGIAGMRISMTKHDRSGRPEDGTLCISPTGDALLLSAVGHGGMDLYLFNLHTHQISPIASTPEYEATASFSPDGQSIVYSAGHKGDRADHLYIRDLHSNQVKQITSVNANDCSPSFYPDGNRIVFTRDTHYNWGGLASSWSGGGALWSINRDGNGLRPLFPKTAWATYPSVSSDGKRLLWWDTDGVYMAQADGTGVPQMITGNAMLNAREAVFSPRGDHIAFSAGEYAPDQKIYIMPISGGPAVLVAQSPYGGCIHPVFSPDGQTLYYFVGSSLWQIGVSGANPQQLIDSTFFDNPGHWRP